MKKFFLLCIAVRSGRSVTIKKLSTFLGLLLSLNLQAQIFEYINSNDSDQIVKSCIILDDGSSIYSGDAFLNDSSKGYLFKLNNNGEFIKRVDFRWDQSVYCEKILNIDSDLAVVSVEGDYMANHLLIIVVDTNLNFKQKKIFPIQGYSIITASGIVDHYGDIVVSGILSNQNNNWYNFFYRINTSLDSLSFSMLTQHSPFGSLGFIEKSNNSGYYYSSQPGYYPETSGQSVLDINYDLTLDTGYHVMSDIQDRNTFKWIDDNSLIMTGGSHYFQGEYLGIVILDSLINTKRFASFGNNDIDCSPGIKSNVDYISGNTIFYGGTYDFDVSSFFSNHDSKYYIFKLDTTLQEIWSRKLGEPNYYHTLWGVTATEDGGCILYGTRYDYNVGTNRDIYILKVDQDGNSTVGTPEVIPAQSVKIYPNPGSDKIYIDNCSSVDHLTVYDFTGNIVLEKSLNVEKLMITNSWDSGIYFFLFWKEGQIFKVEKFLKTRSN